MQLDLASRQPLEIMQTRDGLVDRAVVLTLPFKVNRGRIDGEVVKHRAQCLTWPIAEHLARDHEYLAAVEVIEKRRELEPVPAWPEVAVVEQGHLRAASLPAGGHLMHIHRLHAGDGVAYHINQTCLRNNLCHPLGDTVVDVGPRITRRALPDCGGSVGAVEERLVPVSPRGQFCSAMK